MKRYNTIIIAIILIAVAAYLYFSNRNGTIDKALKDFAVEDTSAITKIFLVDKGNYKVLLERKDGIWMVNNKYEVRKDAIDILLKTIKRIEVKSTIPKQSHNTIIKLLAAKSIKIEIYKGDEMVKTYYVGHPTQDQEGTYMLLENSSEPFITYIPGFRGYLSTRYTTDEDLLRVNNIFNYKFNEIKSISLRNIQSPEMSFEVYNYGNNTFGLKSLATNKMISEFDTAKVKDYISYCKYVNYETPVNTLNKKQQDSVLAISPTYTLTITDINSKSKTIKTYLRANDSGLLDENGEQLNKYDTDRMYTFLDNNKFMVTIQYFVFDPILIDINQFLFNNTKNIK